MLGYTLSLKSRRQHLWSVTLKFTQTVKKPVTLSLANWVAGSYLIRDFAKHLFNISATAGGKTLALTQLNKNSWRTLPAHGEIVITYQVYGLDSSPRASFLDAERGFFDGACLFLLVNGAEEQQHCLHIVDLPPAWQIATGMQQLRHNMFTATNYAAFIDYPMELGVFEILPFTAAAVPHKIIISGGYTVYDRERLTRDIAKICTAQIQFFGTAPFQDYTFLLRVKEQGYGGLEHRNSSSLIISDKCLPLPLPPETTEKDYINLLGLFSHEYFHAWNIKSIKPQVFQPYDLNQELYTQWLWFFEGVTSFYDDWFLAHSGVISPQAYVTLLATTVNQVLNRPGNDRQSLDNASFNAWTKYYQADENSLNMTVSYYQKGSLAALCLDWFIREQSLGKFSLHDLMHSMYRRYRTTGKGLSEDISGELRQNIADIAWEQFITAYIKGVAPLPLKKSLAAIGLDYSEIVSDDARYAAAFTAADPGLDFGANFAADKTTGLIIREVKNNSNAELAGFNPDDQIIALNAHSHRYFTRLWQQLKAGDKVTVHFFRGGILRQTTWTAAPVYNRKSCVNIADSELFNAWLLK